MCTTPAPPKVSSESSVKFPFNIAADFPLAIVRGDTDKTHGTGFDSSHAGAKGIFLAHRSGDDFLEIHADVLEKMLGKIAAVKTNSLVRIVGVVVIPVEQGAGSFGSQLQRVHSDHAGNVNFAGAGHALVPHHHHNRARPGSE